MTGKLALRSLRHRTPAFLATFLALLIGATIVMACGGLMETGIRNNVPPQRLAGARILVTGDRVHHQPGEKKQRVLAERVELPAGLTGKVEAVPGVRAAVGERTFDVALPDGGGTAEAHGWESAALTPYALAEGAAPRRGEVVLDAALARRARAGAGDRVRVVAHGGAAEYRVSGVARPAAGRDVPRRTLFFSAPDADRLSAHPGTVADIAVVTESGADAGAVRKGVKAALDGQPVTLLTGDDRGAVEHPEVLTGGEDLVAISGVFGGLGITVAMFVVAGTVGLSARQRFRELALLRAVGATTGQIRRLLLGETLLIAVFAGAAAWPAGPALGRWLFGRMTDTGMVAETVEFSQGWIPALPAYGSLLLTSVVGTLVGTLRAVRAKPVEALGEAAAPQRWFHPVRLGLGLLFLAGATALALVTALVLRGPVAASTAGPTVMCCVIGLALLGPWFVKLVSVLLHWPVRLLTGASGRLAALNCRASALRTAAVATPVMLATAITTGMLYLQTSVAAATDREFTGNLRADAVLTSAAGGIDPALVATVRGLPGVAAASASVTSTVFTERPHDGGENKRGTTLQGVDAEGAGQVLAIRPTAGRLADLKGNAVALPEAAARRMHRGVGDTIGLRMGDGASVDVRIVALFPAREGFETALASTTLLAPHTTTGLPAQILVKAAPGVPAERLTDELGRLVARHPGLKVSDRDEVTARRAENTRTQMWANYLIVGMLVAYTTLAVVNSTVVAVGARRREFALQRLTGATKGQVLRMMAVESLYVAAVGLILGTLAAATTLVPFSLSVSDTWQPSGPASIYLAVVAAAGAVTLVSTLLPTWAALRARPVEAAKA
ncbi:MULTISPECIES: FtsX-like permease family protein [Streptomyces]|uniref:FtsX-like permease family protein n=1 Tax=Streptomyces TaxID=1883 RepID=UPI00163BF8E6|nr:MULTISPECIES: ABC transporter permease [Streptomyces]MBC2876086.1 ABC transporter permease [Streptomyces sp. TYQ1024]UBI38445.1 ABC transporter permease [Streptomyces mobaraensis]UKW31030.1 ABC transporter permease [Streptomyces sp. TYQ1024]